MSVVTKGPHGAPRRPRGAPSHTPLSRVGCVTTSMQVRSWCGASGVRRPGGSLVYRLLRRRRRLHGRLVTVRPKGGSMRVRCGCEGSRSGPDPRRRRRCGGDLTDETGRAAANYHGVATADAARVTVIVPNAPATSSIVDTGLIGAGGGDLGAKQAFGSNPYPGDNAVSLPGRWPASAWPGVPSTRCTPSRSTRHRRRRSAAGRSTSMATRPPPPPTGATSGQCR